MRLITWNVNGIRTVRYHPQWNQLSSFEAILDGLGGDIVCFQETKITTAQIDKSLACMDGYDSFFSCYRRSVKAIHGTSIHTKRSVTVPVKAEEGLSSLLLPSTTLPRDRIGSYPLSSDLDLGHEMKELDSEGRTTVCDFGLFVLINLYCPNEGDGERLPFKNDFNTLVTERALALIRAGRQVIVVGDLNVVNTGLETEESDQEKKTGRWSEYQPLKWLAELVRPEAPFIDITRRYHPARKEMNTCWNTLIDARPTNYGCRLDYILVTPGLVPWIKDSDIMPSVMGSDHCPVYVDFHDEIEVGGQRVSLWDKLNPGRAKDDPIPSPPPFAARFYDAFNGSQTSVLQFFGKPVAGPSKSTSPVPPSSAVHLSVPLVPRPSLVKSLTIGESLAKLAASRPAPAATEDKPAKGKGKEKDAGGQKRLDSFFKSPAPAASPLPKPKKQKKRSPSVVIEDPPDATPSTATSSGTTPSNSAADYSELDDYAASAINTVDVASAWSAIFARKEVPKCDGHDEPTRLWTVNKPGINKGRHFYMCARPVGTGYDKGQAKLHVNPLYRCNYFEWVTSVKRPAGTKLDGSGKKSKS